MTQTVVIYPRGVRTEVPVDVCRCPVLDIGDGCPVHQQLPDDMAHLDRASLIMPLLLTKEEIAVLLISLAQAVTPRNAFGDDIDLTMASAIVWQSPVSTQIQRSLATCLAEALY